MIIVDWICEYLGFIAEFVESNLKWVILGVIGLMLFVFTIK